MTIGELYEWAEKHNALDLILMKNINLDFYDIHDVYLVDFGKLDCDRNVILD